MILVFVVMNGLLVAGKNILTRWGIDQDVAIIGNLILFLVSLAAFLITRNSLKSDNPNVFVRAMYSGFMIKLFVCAAGAFTYFMMVRPDINKPGLVFCMVLYIVYTAIEVSTLTKLLRKKKNA
jgi:small neutral amino acid transporter SnatA (MarC family)